jgi:hypothetical protein
LKWFKGTLRWNYSLNILDEKEHIYETNWNTFTYNAHVLVVVPLNICESIQESNKRGFFDVSSGRGLQGGLMETGPAQLLSAAEVRIQQLGARKGKLGQPLWRVIIVNYIDYVYIYIHTHIYIYSWLGHTRAFSLAELERWRWKERERERERDIYIYYDSIYNIDFFICIIRLQKI